MDEEIKQELNKILNELPGENSWLDYKAKAYEKYELAGLVNDLCAFLNSEQSYGKNKYIICGIGNNKSRLGINQEEMLDDHYFQDAAKHIYPIPKIETGIFKHVFEGKEYIYGYILICKSNDDRIYEVYNEQIKKNDNQLHTIKEIYDTNAFAPVAWIRIGSTKDILKETTRRKIYLFDSSKKNFSLNNNFVYKNIDKTIEARIMKTALLFGKWNEKNENDKNIIEKYSGISYNDFIEKFRLISKAEKDFIFKNGIWEINNRAEYVEMWALDFYKEDFEKFNSIIVEILSEKHPKLKLESDKRRMANIYNKITKYSEELRDGVAETLVIVEYLKNYFKNCKNDVANFVILVVREILKDSDWYIWASLDELLVYLAEAAPHEYLNQFKQYLTNDKEKRILFENESDITTYNYSTSIYWSLELIAWNTDYCVQVCMILSKLAKEDEKAIDHIVNIILPWYPNTNAPFIFRFTSVENIIKENILVGWKVLKKIMPGETSYTTTTYKPKYIDIPDEDISITNEEYYEQVDAYIDLMIKYCKNDNDKLIDLIDLLDSVSKDNFDKICNYLKSSKVRKKSDKSKYKLWDKLESVVYWIRKNSDIKGEIKNEMISKISNVITNIKPNNILYVISRLFKKDNWEIIEDYDKYDLSEKKLCELQYSEVNKLYIENGINSIIELAKIVENSYSLGMIVSKLKISDADENKVILVNLDKRIQLIEFAKGYVYNKYNRNNAKININLIDNLSMKAKINFMLMMPYDLSTFKIVEKLLGNNYKKYWEQVDIRIINDESNLNYSISKLMEVNRYGRVLWMYRLSLHNNQSIKYNNNVVLDCLDKINNNFNKYDICEAIKELQKNNADKNRLFYIEWKYLPLLNHGDYRPITMEKCMSTDVHRYSEILELAYKEHSKEKTDRKIDPNIATNAYRLLNQWRMVPGIKDDGYIDSEHLLKWYDDMKKICSEIDRLEAGLSCFGKVLFYTPKSKDNFWIDKTVAGILNTDDIARRSYETEAFNSVGIVNWDEHGTAYMEKYDEYKKKANDTEVAGYYNFASALREIADNFKFHAEHMKDTYKY